MGGVWAILQHREGKAHPGSWEAVTAAKRIAEAIGSTADAVLLGSEVKTLADEAARTGVASVRVADHPALASYVPGPYTVALVGAAKQEQPRFVVFPHTYQSVDYMAGVAHGYDAGVLSEVIALQAGADGVVWTRPILQGKLQARARVRGDGPMVVSVQAGAFPAADRATGQTAPIVPLAVDAGALQAERDLLGVEDAAADVVDLTACERIVAVGRGIGGPDKLPIIRELAAALGAEIGASRPVIDNGWLPRDRQIGSSGQTVAPKLYVAVGISGAIQHLVGMKGANCTVAINKDPGAPIFNVADYGIVGDLFEIVPALTKALLESRPS
ncbi:MAG TPA: electron transfer flavoprotein subunit alpha/FixB family protein [Thermoanaerobaculia bacterium]|nr:electron transfer flavoprotein subunit alpha/FixB family protein [Thermoanaerobaculia bacterium]